MQGILLAFALLGTISNTQVKNVPLQDPHPEPEYYTVYFDATAYDDCYSCCGKSDGITASGVKATANHTIAAPPEYEFGQIIEIKGIKYVVEDRGGSIKGNHIDIFFDTHEEACTFGRQYVEGKVYYK